MVLLKEKDPAVSHIDNITSWDESFTSLFLAQMAVFGWTKIHTEENTLLTPPPGGAWCIQRIKTSCRYWYETSECLYNPQYDIFYYGMCVGTIKVIVYRHSTSYIIKWFEESLKWVAQWKQLAPLLEDQHHLHLVKDFFIGRSPVEIDSMQSEIFIK
jgi:hypothetical protein